MILSRRSAMTTAACLLTLGVLALCAGCFRVKPPDLRPPAHAGAAAPAGPDAGAADPGPAPDHRPGPAPSGREKAAVSIDRAAKVMGWISGLLLLVAVLSLVASFVSALVPRGTSAACVAGALLGYVLQYALYVYFAAFAEAVIWGSLVILAATAVVCGVPWFKTLARLSQSRAADALAAKGEHRAAVAVQALATPSLLPGPDERKALLTTVRGATRPVSLAATARAIRKARGASVPTPTPEDPAP